MQYVGSGVASVVVGWIIESIGWSAWAYALFPAPAFGLLAVIVLNGIDHRDSA